MRTSASDATSPTSTAPARSHSQIISTSRPGCIIFLLDQSYSMNEGIAGSPRPKIDALATGINRFIGDLISLCEKGEEKPRHYFDLGVIGYTTDRSKPPIVRVGPMLKGANGTLAGRDLVSVVDLFDDPVTVEERQKMVDDGDGGLISTTFDLPIWYRKPPEHEMGGTPMCAAFDYVRQFAEVWCANHPHSFPPVVVHLNDGESDDGDPERAAERLTALSTQDGNLLLFNCCISDLQANPVVFPTSESVLPDDWAKALFRMSSELPKTMRDRAEVMGMLCSRGARGMVFNADGAQMLLLLRIEH